MSTPAFEDIRLFINAAWDGDTEGMKAYIDKFPDALEATKGEPIHWTAMMWAAQADKPMSIGLLLDRGAQIDARDANGQTPLMLAAHRGNATTVAFLIERGADVLLRDDKGQTAADCARRQDKFATAVLLDGVTQARQQAMADAERREQDELARAARAVQDQMRATARSRRFKLNWGTS